MEDIHSMSRPISVARTIGSESVVERVKRKSG
jgi:hypothetical protein